MTLRSALFAAALGTGCFVLALVLGGMGLPEGVAPIAWLVALPVAGFLGARSQPGAGAWFGSVLIAVHWPLLFLQLAITGELTEPSSSTGGMVTLFIVSVWIAVVSPLPIVAAWLGGRAARSA